MSHTIWFTGLSGSGKTTLANIVKDKYRDYIILDGDNLRQGLSSDLGFSIEDRNENIRRVIELCKIFNDNGINVITAFISPIKVWRLRAKLNIKNCFIIYCHSRFKTCEKRDVKGLYAKARAGIIKDFTGIDSLYETGSEDFIIDTEIDIEQTKSKLFQYIREIRESDI